MGLLLQKETLIELCCKTYLFAQVNSGTVSKENIFFFLMKIFFITYQLKHQYFNCFSLSLIYTILRNATLRSK